MAQLSYRRHRFPAEMIQHAIWLYLRFGRTAVNVLGNTVATKLVTRFGGRAPQGDLPSVADHGGQPRTS
jgi:hypothetical protein